MVDRGVPIVSVIASAARPTYWLDLYATIREEEIPFELVFVGPNAPGYTLPENFRFIQTGVKPTQCWEIAARVARGEYLVITGDDFFYDIASPFTRLYKSFLSYEDTKLILSCRYVPKVFGEEFHIHAGDIVNKIYLPTGFIMLKDYWLQLGGLDKNFIALYWDLDLCFRVVVDGGVTALSAVPVVEQPYNTALGTSLCAEYGPIDRDITLKKFWPMFGRHNQFKRTAPFEPFDDYNILTESQGPKGRWL